MAKPKLPDEPLHLSWDYVGGQRWRIFHDAAGWHTELIRTEPVGWQTYRITVRRKNTK